MCPCPCRGKIELVESPLKGFLYVPAGCILGRRCGYGGSCSFVRSGRPPTRPCRRRPLQPPAQPGIGLHRDLSRRGPERVESGTLWLKKPRKMRWEYRSPKEKLFISDGEVVWFYMPAERQVRKTTLKKLDDVRSPLAFLLGKTKLENELRGLSKAVDQAPLAPGDTLLRGVPQGVMAGRAGERGAAGDHAVRPDCPHRIDGRGRGERRSFALPDGRRMWR